MTRPNINDTISIDVCSYSGKSNPISNGETS